MYIVKSKKSLKGMFDILQEQNIKANLISDNQIEISIQHKTEESMFIRLLSLYIIYTSFKDIIMQSLINLGVPKVKAEKKAFIARNGLEETNYFTDLTSLLLLEYFKSSKTLNVDSFILFNMKGYKQELKIFAELIINNSIPYINEHEKQLNTQELFDIIRQHAIKNNINFNDFLEIHINYSQNNLIFNNAQGELIDDEFLKTKLGCSLIIYEKDTLQIEYIYKGILFLRYLAVIFDIQKVILHKTLPENDIKKFIASNLIAEISDKIQFVKCDGCEKCCTEN